MIDTSLEDVARAALIEAYNCGEQRRECGGVIYERAGKYWYSIPVTQSKPFSVDLGELYVPDAEHTHIAGDYHNHLCTGRNKRFAEFFSMGDVLVNTVFQTVGYMLDGCTGNIHRFDPAQDDRDDEEVDMSSGRKFYLTIGHLSGWIPIYDIRPKEIHSRVYAPMAQGSGKPEACQGGIA
jgi:hypothetical protein